MLLLLLVKDLVSNDTESSNLTETLLYLCRKSWEMTGSIRTVHLESFVLAST